MVYTHFVQPRSVESHLSTLNKIFFAPLPLSFILRIPFVLNEFSLSASVLMYVGVWATHLSISRKMSTRSKLPGEMSPLSFDILCFILHHFLYDSIIYNLLDRQVIVTIGKHKYVRKERCREREKLYYYGYFLTSSEFNINRYIVKKYEGSGKSHQLIPVLYLEGSKIWNIYIKLG
jgi:hypothetical protein